MDAGREPLPEGVSAEDAPDPGRRPEPGRNPAFPPGLNRLPPGLNLGVSAACGWDSAEAGGAGLVVGAAFAASCAF